MEADARVSKENWLDKLVSPLGRDAFFAEYHERAYYRTPQPVPGALDLLSIERIDEIIADSELPRAALSMAQGGRSLAREEYTYSNGNIDRGAVLDNFREGATIVLPQLHFADGKLYDFCLALEREFGARVQTNIYLTPPNATGFGVHYDDHDVFVIQISGAKKWEIYGASKGLPYKGEGFRKGVHDTGELQDSFILNPGECLYVPRGLAHRAPNEGDAPSLHITVGILVKTWAEFMLEAVAAAGMKIPEMRHSLPRDLFFDAGARARHRAHFAELLGKIAEDADFDAAYGVFSGNFVMGQGPRPRGALNALCRGIGPEDRLQVRESVVYTLDLEGEEPQIALAGSTVPLAPDLAPQLAARLAAGDMAMADFIVADEADLRDTIETLVAFGLLVPA